MPKDFINQYSFDSYVSQLFKQNYPNYQIDANAKINVNLILHHVCNKVIAAANNANNQVTLSAKAIRSGTLLVFPETLADQATSNGNTAVTRYYATDPGTRSNRRSAASRSSLVIPPSLAENIIRAKCAKRVAKLATIYLAAVLETVAIEVLNSSVNALKGNKKRVTPREVLYGCKGVSGLAALCDGVFNGGVFVEN